MATAAKADDEAIEIYKQLEIYPWSLDKEFQGGLSAILGPNPNHSQINDLTLRAQCFYLSRKKSIPIDFNGYKAYLASRPTSASIPAPPSTSLSHSLDGAGDVMSIKKSPSTSSYNPEPASQTTIPNGAAPHPRQFLEIVELIQSGKPIPGIREIPDIVLTGQASQPSLPQRKKPWEKELPDTTEGTFGDRRDYYIEQELPEEMTQGNKVEDKS